MSIKHKFVSLIPDGIDNTLVRPSDWNQDHIITPIPTETGVIIRYNVDTDGWEVASEPLKFKGLILTPTLASLIEEEGAIFYSSAEKAILVCVGI